MPLPNMFGNVITKAVPDAFQNSEVVPGLLEYKGTEDMSMFV